MDKTLRKELECFAARIRLEALKEFMTLGFGHIGGCRWWSCWRCSTGT
jgi:hypothetical protein